jgi:hypothetical protein
MPGDNYHVVPVRVTAASKQQDRGWMTLARLLKSPNSGILFKGIKQVRLLLVLLSVTHLA